ncbi:hypothetical protein [Paenibacillus pectinilyticus]|uniref:hypothetical protein n=1 Tax=Paenibacillus pectinilyticus TaxID=512399 RepID=UPI000A4321C4|nr:hypothetical protein [Paenibacillus pectinilyticus]
MTNHNPSNMEGTDPFNEKLTQAIQLHMDGVAGNVAAVQEAYGLLEQLRADYPSNPLVDAYYGSTMILIARDKTKALEKLKWSNQGLKILDNSVAADSQDSTIRLLRGKASYNLPEKYFQRAKTVIEDYTFLLNKQDDMLNTDGQLQLIYELGDAYTRIGRNEEAATYFRRLENETQNSAWHQLSNQKLQTLEGKPALEIIPNENPTTMLIEATRSVGSALLNWADEKKKRELAQQEAKERAKERELAKAKEEAREKARELAKEKAKKLAREKAREKAREVAREKAKELAKEQAIEKEREAALEHERQVALEKERQLALEHERQLALEHERQLALEYERQLALEHERQVILEHERHLAALKRSKARTLPRVKPKAKPKTKPMLKQKTKPMPQQKLKSKTKPKAKPMTNLKVKLNKKQK